jgi:hypothetical protein
MRPHRGLEVEVGEHVAGDDEDRLVQLRRREPDRPRRPEVGGGGRVADSHTPAAAVAEMPGDGLREEIEEDQELGEAVALQ